MEDLPFGNYSNNNNTNVPSTSSHNYNIMLTIGFPIFLINTVAVFILMRSEKLVYQIRYLSMNLSLADSLLGLMLITPPWMFEDIFSCKVKKYFNAITITCSLTTATFINLDRCLSIYFNMRYLEIVSKERLKAACVFAWFWALLVSYIEFYTMESSTGLDCRIYEDTPRKLHYVASIIIRMKIFINILMYLYMVYYVKKKMVKLPKVTGSGVQLGKFTTVREHTIRKVTVITGFSLVCYTPVFILTDLEIAFKSPLIEKLKMMTEILAILNSVINPLLYVWRYYETRYQLLRILYKFNRKKAKELYRNRQQYFSSFDICIH